MYERTSQPGPRSVTQSQAGNARRVDGVPPLLRDENTSSLGFKPCGDYRILWKDPPSKAFNGNESRTQE